MNWPFPRCRRTAIHVRRTPRLLVVSARTVDYWRHNELAGDAEALHWLGWDRSVTVPLQQRPLVARLPIVRPEWAIPPTPHRMIFTAIDRTSLAIAGELTIRLTGDEHHIGGVMRKDFRGQGHGTEFLTEVVRLAHKHFGLRRVVAGCEVDNTASRRWLARSGFAGAEGPQTYVLDNGREIKSLWWEHVDEKARRRCPLLSPMYQETPARFP